MAPHDIIGSEYFREEIAKIIDPEAWSSYEAVRGTLATEWREGIVAKSRAKADEIIRRLKQAL
jgi:hypothetical protein